MNSSRNISSQNRRGWVVMLATGFWLGFFPYAPGTLGSVWGVLLAWGIHQIPFLAVQIVVILALCAVGVPICSHAAKQLDSKDPGCVVWDEIASLPLTFFLISDDAMSRPIVLIVGFALHRIFDISKPPPARQLERLPSGLGIMADDWAAGIYSCIALHLFLWSGLLSVLTG